MQTTIYIYLEEDSAYRPTQAIALDDGLYHVLPTPDYDPEDEDWQFVPGSIVRCEERESNGQPFLLAVEKLK